MSDELSDDPSEWIHYQEFAEDRSQKYSHMLEQFELGGGPGPPFDFPEPPDFFPPPPPIPGSVEECETFSSHFDNCDISKVSSNSFNLQQNTFPKNISLKTELSCFFSESCESLSTTLFPPSSFT